MLLFHQVLSELKHHQPGEHVDSSNDAQAGQGRDEIVVIHRSSQVTKDEQQNNQDLQISRQ
jgi:hypothetical protein